MPTDSFCFNCAVKSYSRKHSGFPASSVNRLTVKPSSQNWLFTSKNLIYPKGIYLNSQLVTNAQHTWQISQSHNAINLLPSLAAFSVKNVTNNYHYQPIRHIQTSASWCKEESKVEKTVKALKDSANSPAVPAVEPEKTAVVAKKSIWQKIVGVCKHYYHGFRLLAIDVKICTKLLWQLMNGKNLTRREYNQVNNQLEKCKH